MVAFFGFLCLVLCGVFLGGGCGVLGFYCVFYLFVGLGGFVFLFGEDWGGSNFSFLFVLGFLVGFVVSNGGRF